MEPYHAWANTALVVVGIIVSVWFANRKALTDAAAEFAALKIIVAELKVKTDTMWDMLLKRAVVEAVTRGLAEVHSPIRLINDSGDMLVHMADEIRAFYAAECQGMSESRAALALERQFGTRLAKEVCIPNNISFGICLIIALAIARGEPLTEILDNALPMNEQAPIVRHAPPVVRFAGRVTRV